MCFFQDVFFHSTKVVFSVEFISGKTAKMAEKHFLSEVFNRMTVAEKECINANKCIFV